MIAILRRLLLGFALLATLLAMALVVENWRGDRAWAQMERELTACGERLDFAAFQPRAVPDERNFFKTPQLERVLYDRSWRAVMPTRTAPAADVLAELEPLRPILDELRTAARLRPQAALRPMPNPFVDPMVSMDATFRVGQALRKRALAEIELGRFDEAFADIYALQRFGNHLADHPITPLTFLVGIAMQNGAADAIAAGRQRHMWSDAHLIEFQNEFGKLHAVAGFRHAMQANRSALLYMLDARPKLPKGFITWLRWLPHGWAQQNKVTFCRRLESEVFDALTTDPDRIRLAQPAAGHAGAVTPPKSRSPYRVIADQAVSNFTKLLESLGTEAEELRLAEVACAVERHRLAQGRLPASLAELVPSFLPTVPNGILNGQPLRYSQSPQGAHQVYSLGWDGRDDGGKGDDLILILPGAP